jgi:hypothetical protein
MAAERTRSSCECMDMAGKGLIVLEGGIICDCALSLLGPKLGALFIHLCLSLQVQTFKGWPGASLPDHFSIKLGPVPCTGVTSPWFLLTCSKTNCLRRRLQPAWVLYVYPFHQNCATLPAPVKDSLKVRKSVSYPSRVEK